VNRVEDPALVGALASIAMSRASAGVCTAGVTGVLDAAVNLAIFNSPISDLLGGPAESGGWAVPLLEGKLSVHSGTAWYYLTTRFVVMSSVSDG
jgi:hypothetical protein